MNQWFLNHFQTIQTLTRCLQTQSSIVKSIATKKLKFYHQTDKRISFKVYLKDRLKIPNFREWHQMTLLECNQSLISLLIKLEISNQFLKSASPIFIETYQLPWYSQRLEHSVNRWAKSTIFLQLISRKNNFTIGYNHQDWAILI
jgi:hypothetical protein